MNVRETAKTVLDHLEALPPALVRAGRRGLVAALNMPGEGSYVFRNVEGRPILEIWPSQGSGLRHSQITKHPLPKDLQKRTQALLDSLP